MFPYADAEVPRSVSNRVGSCLGRLFSFRGRRVMFVRFQGGIGEWRSFGIGVRIAVTLVWF